MIGEQKICQSFLDECFPSETKVVKALVPYLHPAGYGPQHVLWNEGDKDGRLVVLDSGRVKILRHLLNGKPILVYVFGPGDVFGFLPFVDGGVYPATAITMEPVEARVMSRAKLRQALRAEPDLGLMLLATLGRRLRDAFVRIGDASIRDAMVQTSAALVSLATSEELQRPLCVVEIPGPSYSLAEQVGLTPESFSRALTRLVNAGVLHRMGPRKFQVLDVESLRNAAAGRLAGTHAIE